jgi:hypothetical protein
MKNKFFQLIVCAFVTTKAAWCFAQGVIVPNGVTFPGLSFLGGYELDVRQHPTNPDITGFFLTALGRTPPSSTYTNTFTFSTYLDEGVRVFLVSSNDPVSLQAIQSQSYPELGQAPNYVFNSGSPFLLGLYTGYAPVNGVYSNPMFGWANLVNDRGVIKFLGGSLAYGAQGIFAGTQNFVVPEPTGVSILLLSVTLVAFRNRHGLRRN